MRWVGLFLVAVTAMPVLAQEAPVDRRAAMTQLCVDEAQRRGAVMGARGVSLLKVRDTDLDGGGKGDVTATMEATFDRGNGKLRTKRMTMRCKVKNGVITEFRMK